MPLGLDSAADDEQTAELGERWASHLLVLTPPPTPTPNPIDNGRHWPGLRRFLLEQRMRERDGVLRVKRSMQDTVWAFVEAFSKVVGTATDADDRVMRHVNNLARSAESCDPNALRAEVLSAAKAIRDDIQVRKQHQMEMTTALASRVSELTEELCVAKREASLDALTQAANRRAFDEHIARICELCSVFGRPACLVCVDVDHFKRVNDTWGHAAGDKVLRALSDCMHRQFLRRTDFLARTGGEEFAALLFETDQENARAPVDRMLRAVREMVFTSGSEEWSVTVSAGVAQHLRGEDVAAWIERADQAMYAAKRAGRNRAVFA
jgi:diguanylate cyclase